MSERIYLGNRDYMPPPTPEARFHLALEEIVRGIQAMAPGDRLEIERCEDTPDGPIFILYFRTVAE